MENIFRSENFPKYAQGIYGIGQWVTRNGTNAMAFMPSPFWYGTDTDENKLKSRGVLREEFAPNTQYLFDFWVDADDSYYDAESKNVPGGFVICYTDGTEDQTLVTSGNRDNPIGWQHKMLISDPSKSIQGLNVYYYTSTPVYYRWDSSISAYHTDNINKNGIIEVGQLREGQSEFKDVKGGLVICNNFIEI